MSKVNTYTVHTKTVKDGIIQVAKGTVVTSIVILSKGGCKLTYRKYEDCALKDMLVDGGIEITSKKCNAATKKR